MTRDNKSNRAKRAKQIRAEIDKLMNQDATPERAEDEMPSRPSPRELTDAAAAAAQAEAESKAAENRENESDPE